MRRGYEGRRAAAAVILLAMAFLLLVPDPHDHGDAGSLGGVFRSLMPGATPAPAASQASAVPQRPGRSLCPVHLWHQIAGTGLVLVLLVSVALTAGRYAPHVGTVPSVLQDPSTHTRGPPIFA
jgi:hypothetical protein